MQDFIPNNRYLIKTPHGWDDFEGVTRNYHFDTQTIDLDGIQVTGSPEHSLFQFDRPIRLNDISEGDTIDQHTVTNKTHNTYNNPVPLYDIFNVSNCEHAFTIQGRITSKNCDELSFAKSKIAREMWAAVFPTLSTGGRCIVTSTPSDDETLFAELWKNATKTIDEHGNDTDVGVNGFKALKVKWDEHPERDDTYKKLQIAQFGEEKFRREHELEFISMEDTLVDPVMLSTYEGIEPISKSGQIRWYAPINKDMMYVVGYDPSLGTGRDNAAIVVYEFPTMTQVAEWIHNKSDVPAQIKVLKKILDMFRDAGFDEDNIFWSLENNSIGEAPLVMIKHEIGDDEFFGTFMKEKKKRNTTRVRGGFFTDHTEKMKACNRFKIWFEQGKLTVNSKAMIAELKGFVAQGRTYKARAGDTDDIVMATLLVVRMVEIIMQDEEEYLEELGVTANNLFEDEDDDDDEGWGAPMPML